MSNADRRQDVWSRLAWGVVLLTAGIVFWLDRIGNIDARDYLQWWPAALIFIGVTHLPARRWVAGAIWIAVGLFFLVPRLGYPAVPVWRLIGLWPLLISVGGVTLILQALRPKPRGATYTATAVMAGNVLRVGSQDLAGADVVAVMGGCEVDLTGAKSPNGEVLIHVLAFWGGIEISVPRGWKVVDGVAEILGGFEDKTEPAPDNAPRVVIRGSAIMGGIEVNHPAEVVA